MATLPKGVNPFVLRWPAVQSGDFGGYLSGLIPNGVYSIWHVRLDSASNPIGVGSLGPNDGSQNAFQATADGDGHVSAIMPGGPLYESEKCTGRLYHRDA